uniref:Uncharacterized protein n=1 Tax=Oncorhynchus kisutch TaxID=8019 RepID=A0A8C7C283_ONCKI
IYLLESGYAVIFRHRHRSLYPFTLGLICWTIEECEECVCVGMSVLMRYQAVNEARLLLPVEFSTLSEYLHHLKAAAQALRPIGRPCFIWLQQSIKYKSTCSLSLWSPRCRIWDFLQAGDGPVHPAGQSSAGTGQQAVVASVLDTRRGYVVVVTPYTQAKLVLTDEEASKDVEIKDSIVSNLTRAHGQIITQQD